VTLTATHFGGEFNQELDEPRVKALRGTLMMQNCDFHARPQEAPDVYLGPELRSAVVLGNRFVGDGERIVNEAGQDAETQILGNVTQ
jgi:hypothetical protein